jgi:tartrate dehydratase beta subunit/fumarate hydratase class I family protein
LKQYYFKKERCEEHKGKVLVIVKGQRALKMKNKVKSLKGHNWIEADDDAISKIAGQ